MVASWKESYDKPRQCVEKMRHHSANKGPYSQAYGLPSGHVRMWELDNKKGRVLKNWCFQTVVLEKTLESPWTARRSNQSILNEINPEYSLEVLMLKLKQQYFVHLMWRVDSLTKTVMLRKIEDKREEGNRWGDGWMASPTQWTWVWVNSRSWWRTGKPGVLQSVHGVTKSWTQLNNWTV